MPFQESIEQYYNEWIERMDQCEVFWDYKCSVEQNGGQITSEKNLSCTSVHI